MKKRNRQRLITWLTGLLIAVAISQQMYGQVGKGWKVRQQRNIVTATSPDDARSLTSVITY